MFDDFVLQLLSLKAELARKHEEANHAKAFIKTKPSKPLTKPKSDKTKSGGSTEDVGQDEQADDFSDTNELHSSR